MKNTMPTVSESSSHAEVAQAMLDERDALVPLLLQTRVGQLVVRLNNAYAALMGEIAPPLEIASHQGSSPAPHQSA